MDNNEKLISLTKISSQLFDDEQDEVLDEQNNIVNLSFGQ